MKRITLFAGHYGSGKTNVAINYAQRLKRSGSEVTLGDLDIVNPYFRTKDSAAQLAAEGIGLVVSEYANSNVDFPALPKEIYSLVAPGSGRRVVLDIGGDDRGALALGRYVPDIVAGGDYEMLGVINFSRPLTRTPEAAAEALREVEAAAGIRFTGLVNNTNLGRDTTAATVLDSAAPASETAALMHIPVVLTCAMRSLVPELEAALPRSPSFGELLPLSLQRLYYQLDVR